MQFLDLACGPPLIAFPLGLRLGAALLIEVVGRPMPVFDDALRMTFGVPLRAEEPWLTIRAPPMTRVYFCRVRVLRLQNLDLEPDRVPERRIFRRPLPYRRIFRRALWERRIFCRDLPIRRIFCQALP